jgi:unsaturated rhamnogalacturonyl hydrolase
MPNTQWSVKMADTCLVRHPLLSQAWEYQFGVILKGIEQVWLKTGDPRYQDYIRANIDAFVQPDGGIRTYSADEYNLDQIHTGALLFELFRTSSDKRYLRAIHLLRSQLAQQPRNSEGGFWHKGIYPHQMWLDGIYMAGPFYAHFARDFNEPAVFDDLAHQVAMIEQHLRDPLSGLLYHGWDATCSRPWADPLTGRSPHFWGRAVGWYAMALVDMLDFLPSNHPARTTFLGYFQSLMAAVATFQDPVTAMWYQVMDQGARPGNYLETSASCMFVYAAAKGVRKAYLSPEFRRLAETGYAGILRDKLTFDPQGCLDLSGICKVAGLSGTVPQPQRDGSFDYYIHEPVVANDYKGVGAFILASVEIEA